MPAARGPAVLALAVATALALLGDGLLYAVLPSQPEAAGIRVAALGVMLSVHRFIRLASNPLGGLLHDRCGRRQPFLLGMALALASTAGYWLTSGFWPLLAARLGWGLAFSLISVGGLSFLLDLTTPADRGRLVGLYQSLVGFGTLLGFGLSGVLTDLLGYRGALGIYTTLTAIGGWVAFRWLHETAPTPTSLAALFRGGGRRQGRDGPGVGAALTTLVRVVGTLDRRILAPVYASFANFFANHGVFVATLGVSVKAQLSSGGAGARLAVPVASLTGVLLASRKLATMAAAPLAGRLSDHPGARRHVATAGALVSVAGFVTLAAGGGVWVVMAGVALTSVGEGALNACLAAWTGDAAPAAHRGAIMGGLATVNDLGGATGPLVGYALAATLGLRWAYVLCAGLMLTATLVLAAVRAPVWRPERGWDLQ